MTTIPWLADALRAEGCKVSEQSGWKNHYRPGSFEPYGVLWHHTGTTTSASNTHPTLNTCINGRPDLEGPLCHVMIGYDGICYVISAGRANHAGACNGFGPFSSSQDGNTQLVGFEIDYDGTQHMSAAQQDAATRCSAAVLKHFKRNEQYAARHEETSTTGKWDTGNLTGPQLRALIKDYLAHGPTPSPKPDEGDFEMMGLVKSGDRSAQFMYTGVSLIWVEDNDHLSRIKGEYKKQTGKDIILTTTGWVPIEEGCYGYLAPNAPDPTTAGVEPGWDFSKHRKLYTK
jgi:hypothetical protein